VNKNSFAIEPDVELENDINHEDGRETKISDAGSFCSGLVKG
jgi:hypothetical protein